MLKFKYLIPLVVTASLAIIPHAFPQSNPFVPDFAFCNTQGAVAVRNATRWQCATGAAGQNLVSQGPGANLIFQNPASGAPGGANTSIQRNNAGAFDGLGTLTASALTSPGDLIAAAASKQMWTGRSVQTSPADGNILFQNNALTAFGLLQLGGTTASFPGIKRNLTGVDIRLADDSGYAPLTASSISTTAAIIGGSTIFATGQITTSAFIQAGTVYAFPSKSQMSSPVDGNILFTDTAAASFGRMQLGGTTASFPAIKRNAAAINIRLADDSADAALTAGQITASGNIIAPSAGAMQFNLRSNLLSPIDGNIQLSNFAVTGFGLLQLGGTTSSFPAIKRSGAAMQFRLADDSALANVQANIYTGQFYTVGAGGTLSSGVNGNLALTDSGISTFGLLQFGGTTSSFPALKRNGIALNARLADDSGDASLTAKTQSIGDSTTNVATTQFVQSTIAVGGVAGNRNRIVNGNMSISQRGTSAISSGVSTVTYATDRFYMFATGAAITGQQVAGGGIFQKALQITGAASNLTTVVGQRIEASQIYDLASSNVTMQAQIACSALTSVTWTAYYANAADNFNGGKTSIASGTFTVNTGLSLYSTNIALPSNAQNGVAIELSTGPMVSGTCNYTGIQLEPGSTATPFEFRPPSVEYLMAQRYYQRIKFFRTTQAGLNTFPDIYALRYQNAMRVAPTTAQITAPTNTNVASIVFGNQDTEQMTITITPTSSANYATVGGIYELNSEL